MRYQILVRRVLSIVPIVTVICALGACGDDETSPTAPRSAAAAAAALADLADDEPPGAHALGGPITMAPDAHQFFAEEMHPTGIRLPEGLPVRFVASGEIGRAATAGLLDFCVKLAPFCEETEEVQAMLHTPLPPWGDTTWFGDRRGYAQMWWDGPGDADGNTIVFGQDQPVIRTTWRGGELWVGHTFWECYWVLTDPHDYSQTKGDCFDMSGKWTIEVVPDDGSETDPKTGRPLGGSAVLTATLTARDSSAPGKLRLVAHAAASDGSTPTDLHWYWIPNQSAGEPPMAVAPRSVTVALAATPIAHVAAATLPYVTEERRATGAVALSSSRASRAASTLTAGPEQPLASCENLVECVADVEGSAGKLVVQALVGGEAYAASAEVGDDSWKLTCPTSVARAAAAGVECKVEPGSVGTKLKVTGWEFLPDDPILSTITRTTDVSSLSWSGMVVTPGTVRVHVTVAGKAEISEKKLAVTPRPEWAGLQMRDTMTYGTTDPDLQGDQPDSLGSLGHNHQSFLTRLTLDSSYAIVREGPNKDLAYLLAMPYLVSDSIHVNEPALDPASAFTARQASHYPHPLPKPQPGPWCAPSQVAAFLPKIKLHEGVTFDPDSSHAGILRKALAAARPAAILEGFVANVSGQSPARAIGLRLDAVFGPTMASTLATADDVKDGGTVKEIIVPCNLNFYHP
ncbi:MAG: hypothetical protein HOQ11_14465 [Gemmatimonadaceae bacterium]|nr:hypothetical protein [Gemmatimonadaceae bacterium]NUQ94349.1 hypothetical protein [Gemmatimonadaceae bacterium]NUR35492.1 hypothetical protein [Gemmatimonadaceae bacterium]NUS98605.1 hypothetical protein [Gemmatimonadaceae bacterium]